MFELWLAFLAGVFSSLHCVGMCGPIVMGCIAPRPIEISLTSSGETAINQNGLKSLSGISPYLLYNSGRIISYSMIGMAAGLIGSTALISPKLQTGFSIILGIGMILMALFQMNVFSRFQRGRKKDSVIQKIFLQVQSSNANEAKFLIGILTPLLPCGLLYGMAAHSAANASPILGALEMGAFAIGSAPALLVTGMLTGAIGTRLRQFGTSIAAILLVIMGLLTIARGVGIYHGFSSDNKEHLCRSVK